MRIIHLVVFACLSILVHSRYRFRFHTCRKEDQAILDRENLVSLRQMTYIDDGVMDTYKIRRMNEIGIGLDYGSILGQPNMTKNYREGGESILRVIEFYGADQFLVLNFFHRTYYFMKRGDEFRISPVDKHSIKPSLKHFVRVYFICAPRNARSALILFGDQAELRKVEKKDGEPVQPRPTKKTKREMKEVKIGDKIVKMCRKKPKKSTNRVKRAKAKTAEEAGDVQTAIPNLKDNRRLFQRALLFRKIACSMAHFGFGVVIALNCVVLMFFFYYFKKGKPIKIERERRRGSGYAVGDTTETKTKSDRKNN